MVPMDFSDPPPKAAPKAKAPPATVLPTSLPSELLRGVPLHTCLEGLGQHWATSHDEHSRDFEFSQVVPRLDEFISHDWATSRWAKLCAMLVIYNSRAACVAAAAVALLWSILGKWLIERFTESTPWMEVWIFLFPVVVVFYLFLFGFQWIRGFFLRPRMIFLDKMCIAQRDKGLKEKGIAGLAGFLSKSQTMTILWSPRYFSRLWCSYELGAFLHLRKADDAKQIQIMPASMGALMVVGSMLIMGQAFANFVIAAHIDAAWHEGADWLRTSLSALASFLGVWYYLQQEQEISGLSEQLGSFSIHQSQNFCCSVQHRMPETGEEILCDRRLVYATLASWYANDLCRDPLEAFNLEVRSQIREVVLKQFRKYRFNVPPSYFFYMWVLSEACVSLAWFGKDLLDPRGSWWLLAEPRVADPLWRFSMTIWGAGASLVEVCLLLEFSRLSQQAFFIERLWLPARALLVAALAMGVMHIIETVTHTLHDYALEVAIAYQLVCYVLSIIVMLSPCEVRWRKAHV